MALKIQQWSAIMVSAAMRNDVNRVEMAVEICHDKWPFPSDSVYMTDGLGINQGWHYTKIQGSDVADS